MTAIDGKITRDDLESSFRALAHGVDDKIELVRPKIVTVSVAALAGVAVVFFILGRRGGRKRSALIEIRRV